MKDFTVLKYKRIMEAFLANGYKIVSVSDYIDHQFDGKVLILRHDIDRYPEQVYDIVTEEYGLGIKSSYYLRKIPDIFTKKLVTFIVKHGHELGYHYETLSQTAKDRGNLTGSELMQQAYTLFKMNLDEYREYYPVNTITMHGDSLSKYNNLDLWKTHSYKELGIFCEPYIDLDFKNIGYITDVGRAWNKSSFNRRDTVKGIMITVRNSDDLIKQLEANILPNTVMINMHPEHWTNSRFRWYKILLIRFVKNNLKRIFVK